MGALLGIGLATMVSPSHTLPVTGIAALLGAVMATAVWNELP
jgi:hypothetical protein